MKDLREDRHEGNAESYLGDRGIWTGFHGRADHGWQIQRRFQGSVHRTCVSRSAVGGPIALVEEGDIIKINIQS